MASVNSLATLKRLWAAEARLHRIEMQLSLFDFCGVSESLGTGDRLEQRLSALVRMKVQANGSERSSAAHATRMAKVRTILVRVLPPRLAGVVRRLRAGASRMRSRIVDSRIGAGATQVIDERQGPDLLGGNGIRALPAPDGMPAIPSELRVAAICDQFTAKGLGPACRCVFLTPEDWYAQINRLRPHVLFVESAWTGLQGEWSGKVSGADADFLALVESCRAAGIRTVFWNKEDPLHFEAFLGAALRFDLVCTTDAASISRYKRELAHDRVHLMPFAVQPLLHHPVLQPGESRESASFFAGAWYGRQPERCRNFIDLVEALALVAKFRIFDRNIGSEDQYRLYPDHYRKLLAGSVDYIDTPKVYRSHRIGLTLNTIKHSPTMFARRAIELMATSTSVYSNHSWALRQLFGDLVVATDDGARALESAYRELLAPDSIANRVRHNAAMRKVLKEHTWDERLRWMCGLLWADWRPPPCPTIAIVARATNIEQVRKLEEMADQQHGVTAEVWIQASDDIPLPLRFRRLTADLLVRCPREVLQADLVAPWNPLDGYGKHYLEDLLLARKFGQGTVTGKVGEFDAAADGLRPDPAYDYRKVDRLALRCCLMEVGYWRKSIGELLEGLDGGFITEGELLSADSLHYRYRDTGRAWDEESATSGVDQGNSIGALRRISRAISTAPSYVTGGAARVLDGAHLATLFRNGIIPNGTSASAKRSRLELVSLLPADREDALFSSDIDREVIEQEGEVCVCIDARPHPGVDIYLDALDPSGAMVRRDHLPAEVNVRQPVAPNSSKYRLAIRVKGPLVTHVDALWLQERAASPIALPGDSRLLLVVNGYPSHDNLYRNAFIHRRVLAYKAMGIGVDVVWVSAVEQPRTYEFQGVCVVICGPDSLKATLKVSRHRAIAVHFLNATLWKAVCEAASRLRTVVWIHGSEIQPWTRRAFNLRSDAERQAAIASSEARMGFWRDVFSNLPANLYFVFVSRIFAEQVWEDLGLQLDENRWSVIPNPIDRDLFSFVSKEDEQRFDVLSIRPHASRIYANDMVAETIQKMSARPDFERWKFTLVGDGPQWEENFASLRTFQNVTLERRFLTQEEIAELHRENGVFLVPTRGDTQGVSRDEAMSSGLVPVTTDAGSVTEFVDRNCAFVCPVDSSDALVAALVEIASNPMQYQRMSRLAGKCADSRSVHEIVPLELRALELKTNTTED